MEAAPSFDVATRLKNSKDVILTRWEALVRSELAQAKSESKPKLRDSLPKFLDHLADAIKQEELKGSPRTNLLRIATEHAEERAIEADYTVEQVIREYELLRKVIFDVLEEEQLLHRPARETIMEAVTAGMAKASGQFAELAAKREQVIQEQLTESEFLFKAIFDHAASGKALIGIKDGKYLKVNRKFCQLHGYTEEELTNKTVHDLTYEEDREKQRKLFAEKISEHAIEWKLEKRNVAKDGHLVWVIASSAILYDPQGNPKEIVTTVVDISDMKKAEAKIRESEAKFRSFAEAMPQMAFIADADGNLIYTNQRHFDYFGVSKGDHDGWAWVNKPLHHPDDLQRTIATWTDSIKTGKPYEIEYRLRRHDGEYRWHLGRAIPQRDETGKILGWFGTNTDIQAQKEMDFKQKELIQTLHAERDLREKFVSTLTHDLRTPLSVIKMSAQILEIETDDPELLDIIKRILRNVSLSDQMIRDLLDTNRIRAGRGLSIKVNNCIMPEVIKLTVKNLEAVYGKRFSIKVVGMCDGYWDPDAIRRITENLATNAIKYGEQYKPVNISIQDLGEKIQLSVQNSGPPIPAKEQRNLFDQFSRSRSAESGDQKGWGIGLTIVKGLADAHCAEVGVTSNEKDGTVFNVTFPRDARPCVEARLKKQETSK